MKVSVAGPVGLSGGEIKRRMPLIEKSAVDSVWFYEVPLEEETIAKAGYVAAITQRIKIGAGIFSPLVRHPATIAMAAAALDSLSNGRTILTMSAGVKGWLEEKFGMQVTPRRAMQALEEALPVVRELLVGKTVNHIGKAFSIRGKLDYPPQRKSLPIFVAAGHERMLNLAGRTADGVLLYFWPPVEYVRWAVQQVRKTAGEKHVETGAFIALRITKERERARKELKGELAFYFSDPSVGPLFLERGGFEDRIGPQLRKLWDSPGYVSRDPGPFMKVIPDELVDEFTLIGTENHIRDRLAAYERAGMTFAVLAFQSKFDEYIGQISQLAD